MTRVSHHDLVASQFGATAAAYVASSVHAKGADLDELEGLVLRTPQASVLDLGCGSGHVSLRFAQWVAQVTAYDLSDGMLEAVRREASRLGRANIQCRQGLVEKLPFADAVFDVAVSRFSAHHWHDVPAALREARRVLRPGGQAAFADVVSPARPLLDTWLQSLELLRDPSHGRNLSIDEWRHALEAAGFAVKTTTTRRLRLDFPSWVARIGTPQSHVQALRSLHQCMPQEAADYFELDSDGSFTVDTMVTVAG